MTDITIYMSANNGEEVLVLPLVPKEIPELVRTFEHSEFATNEKDFTIIGRGKRRTLALELLLPVNKSYRSINKEARQNGKDYIDFWEKWSKREVPMRLIITKGYTTILNMSFTINSLSYKYDKKFDIIAKLDIAEYLFTVDTDITDINSYKWVEIMLCVGDVKGKLKASNVNGHWFVPVRELLQRMGYTVGWNAEERAIYYLENGNLNRLNSNFELYEGTSYGFLRQICDELGHTVGWNAETKEVTIE